MTSSTAKHSVILAWLLVSVLGLALIARTLIFIYDMVRPMPYWDAWEFMKALPSILDGRYTLGDLFGFHNEHRIVTTRLLMLADVRFFDASGYLPTAVLTILFCAIGSLLSLVAIGRDRLGIAAAILTTSLLLSVAQSDNYASGFQVQFPLVDLSAIAAIGLFAISCGPGRSPLWVAGAVIADAVAICSMASGNSVIGPVLLVALMLRAPIRRVAAFAIPAVAMTAAYLVGYGGAETPPSHDIVGILHFAVNYLGSTLRGYPGASLWLGAGLLAGYAAVLATLARAWWLRQPLDVVMAWLAGIAAFTVIGSILTATGRLNYGLETAISSRYAVQSLLFASCVFLMGWRWLRRSSGGGEAQLGLAAALLGLSAASTLAASPLQEWRDRVAAYDGAGEAFANGVFSDRPVTGVYPHPELVRGTLAFMAAHRLGPFSARFAAAYRPPMNAMAGLDIATMPACAFAQDEAHPVGPDGQELYGWAFSPDRPGQGGWILAFDDGQRLLGFARQTIDRPDVSDAYHLAVTRVGYRVLLKRHEDANASKPATLVLVPENHDGGDCRASPPGEPSR